MEKTGIDHILLWLRDGNGIGYASPSAVNIVLYEIIPTLKVSNFGDVCSVWYYFMRTRPAPGLADRTRYT